MIKLIIGYLFVNLQSIIGQDTDTPSASASLLMSQSASPSGTCLYRTYNAAADFSGTQGKNGWYYGYYNNGVFTQFTHYQSTAFASLGWNYNVNSYGYITSNIIMPNGANTCGTPSYGNIAPVLRWYNPIGSCYEDVTISIQLSSGTTNVIPLLTANGNALYSPSNGVSYTNNFNVYNVSSVELSVGPLNGNCNAGQTTFSLIISPIGPSATSVSSRSSSPSALRSVSSSQSSNLSFTPKISGSSSFSGTNTGSVSVSKSTSVSSSLSPSPRFSRSSFNSATATATVFNKGNWTDLGRFNYAMSDLPPSPLYDMTISQCQINCWQNPLCGVIVVTSPCNTISLDSPMVYTSTCNECWLKTTSGWIISADAVSRSLMLYDRVYPPTITSYNTFTTTASARPTSSVITYSSYNMCASSGTTVNLPFVESSVLLITNPIGSSYTHNLNCVFNIIGGSGKQFEIKYLSFDTEVCCDKLTFHNSLNTIVLTSAGNITANTIRYISNTPSIKITFITDGSVLATGIQMLITLQDIPLSYSSNSSSTPSNTLSPSVSPTSIKSLSNTGSSSISSTFTKTISLSSSPSLSSITSKSISDSKSASASSISTSSSSNSKSASASSSISSTERFTNTINSTSTSTISSSTSPSISSSPKTSSTPINTFLSTISLYNSNSYWVTYSGSTSGSGSSNMSFSMCYTITSTSKNTDSPRTTLLNTYSIAPSPTPFTISPKSSKSVCSTNSISESISPKITVSATTSASNLKPAGPPPALPANLSALSLSALGGLFNDMASYPPTLIGDNLQKLGMAALANSPDGEFGISTSVFTVKIKALPQDNTNNSLPLSVGKTEISMPKVAGASAASAIQWTSDPYNSNTPPDSMVLSLNILDSTGSKVKVKNSSTPIIISMNLIPAADDPRFLPLPSFLADCTKGDIYMKSGKQFILASNLVNVTGNKKWVVPCLLNDWRPLNCSNTDTILTYTCPPLNYTPKCQYWDSVSNSWSTDGCTPIFSNASLMICSCTHLTDFSSRMDAVAQANEAIFINAANVYSLEGLEKYKQFYITFGCIALFGFITFGLGVYLDARDSKLYFDFLMKDEAVHKLKEHTGLLVDKCFDFPILKEIKNPFDVKIVDKKKKNFILVWYNRLLFQHPQLSAFFKFDPRLSRLFRFLTIFVGQFNSLFISAMLYAFKNTDSQMTLTDTISLAIITAILNIPSLTLLIRFANTAGLEEYKWRYPILYEELLRRNLFEKELELYLEKELNTDNLNLKKIKEYKQLLSNDSKLEINDMDIEEDIESNIFQYIYNFFSNKNKVQEKGDMNKAFVIANNSYPKFTKKSFLYIYSPFHTVKGFIVFIISIAWFIWCLNYLLLFAASHNASVSENMLTTFGISELTSVFITQPITLLILLFLNYVFNKLTLKYSFCKRFIKKRNIPDLYYFSDPFIKNYSTYLSTSFAYRIFLNSPSSVTNINSNMKELGYAPLAGMINYIDKDLKFTIPPRDKKLIELYEFMQYSKLEDITQIIIINESEHHIVKRNLKDFNFIK